MISSREIQTSVRLILPGELATYAISQGAKSVSKCTLLFPDVLVFSLICWSSLLIWRKLDRVYRGGISL